MIDLPTQKRKMICRTDYQIVNIVDSQINKRSMVYIQYYIYIDDIYAINRFWNSAREEKQAKDYAY